MGISKINSDNPNAPEYGKGYKSENHAGCPCHIVIENNSNCTTVVQRFTRNDQSIDLVEEKECMPCNVPVTDACGGTVIDTSCSSLE